MELREKMCWMALQKCFSGDVCRLAEELAAAYGSLADFWSSKGPVCLPSLPERERLKLMSVRQSTEPEKLWEICREKKIGVLCCREEGYPEELLHFPGYPLILYYYGDPSLLRQPSAAIVGSRDSTAYGRKYAGIFAAAFAAAGFCVVSGMAKGIDAAAHEGALAVRGSSAAVLGCGVDVLYPPENRELYRRLRKEGLVISEYFPGEGPLPWHFPRRNRIISGLARFLLLAECGARSGALITCNYAAEQGRDVWALPGPVSSPSSIGPLQLIRDGAFPAISPEDILGMYMPAKYGPLDRRDFREEKKEKAALSQQPLSQQTILQQTLFMTPREVLARLTSREKKLLELIPYEPVYIDRLLENHSCPPGKFYLDLTKLLSLRLIEKLPGDYYQRI